MATLIQNRLELLLERFREKSRRGDLEKMRRRKWGKAGVAQSLLQEAQLKNLSLEEAGELYRSLPISQRKRQEFLSNPLPEIRECLWFLLYEELAYEIRIWEFLDELGGYRLKGSDQSLASALLCTQNPQMYGLVNATVSKGLQKLGMLPRFERKESNAGRFQKVQETLWRLRATPGLKDFREADDFLEALARDMLRSD